MICLAASSLLIGARTALGLGDMSQLSGTLNVFDRGGNSLQVLNRFDGTNFSLQVTSYGRNGAINWDRIHSEGYQEIANAIALDPAGNLYIAGWRFWQGGKYFWAMKYSSGGDLVWEKKDVAASGCTAFNIIADEAGNAWLGGCCVSGDAHPARVMMLDPGGVTLWSQFYDGGGRNYVRSLALDFTGRVSAAVEVGPGNFGNAVNMVRTVVFDKQGNRVTVY